MNIQDIIEDYLKKNGFDGLYREDECACKIGDLFPCGGEGVLDCDAGYFGPCDCGEQHRFHIGPKKEGKTK